MSGGEFGFLFATVLNCDGHACYGAADDDESSEVAVVGVLWQVALVVHRE